jgi:hypothetical protein
MKKSNTTATRVAKSKIKRKGIHSKKKSSSLKSSKNYTKKYKGQGK